MKNIDASLEKAVKNILAKYDLSQGDLAKQMRKSRATISQMLSGQDTLRSSGKHDLISGVKKLLRSKNILLDAKAKDELLFFNEVILGRFAGSSSDYTKEELDTFTDEKISTANNRIVFLGGLSHRKMIREWFDLLAERLYKAEGLEIWIIVESDQQLFWRSLGLKPDVPRNVRSYKDLQERYRLQCHDLVDRIKQFLSEAYEGNEDKVNQTIERLHFYESCLPIYTFYALIDNTLFVTPRNHLRASLSSTRIIIDTESFEYQQAIECIDYFQHLARNRKFVDKPFAEKTILTADNGKRVYGELFRSTFNQDTRLETRVAHGLIFNKRGELLVRRRGEEEYDNAGLYDKSFGGHWEVGTDVSFHAASTRELYEEIFGMLIANIREVLLNSSVKIEYTPPPPEHIVDCGTWKGSVGLSQISSDMWYYFLLLECERFPSIRRIKESQREVQRVIFADIYIYICDDNFTTYIDQSIKSCNNDIPCKWVDVKDLKALSAREITSDLYQYINLYYPEILKVVASIRVTSN